MSLMRAFKLSLGLVLLFLLIGIAPTAGAAPPARPPLDGYISGCTGQYYNNMTLAGSPVVVRTDGSINFFWPEGTSPAPGINTTQYSVNWTCSVNAPADGNYTFTMTTDDGMNLLIDGNLTIWAWYDQGPSAYAKTVFLNAGAHTVVVQYYNDTLGGTAQVTSSLTGSTATNNYYNQNYNWSPPTNVVVGVWVGQYYNNPTLSGSPVFYHNDAVLNFNWGYGSPDPSVPVDNFSARWDAYQNLPATGNYTIVATSDDGVRVWLDGALVIDGWFDHSPTSFSATRYLAAGQHAFHVEYYERTGGASISVQIGQGINPSNPCPGGGGCPPFYGGDVIVNNMGPGWQAGGQSSNWREAAAGYGGHTFWTFNNSFAKPNYTWARWSPTLPRPGDYDVSAFIPAGLGSTLNARYWIYHTGRSDYMARSQAFYGNRWMPLGRYNFRGGGGEFVSLSDVTYECPSCRRVAFDAVRFSPHH